MTQFVNNQIELQGASESVPRDERFVDIHCHCLPGIDDGPATMPEAIELCLALVRDGIGAAIATPHQLGRFDNGNDANQIRQAVRIMNEKLHDAGIALQVLPGADVRVDERICSLLEEDKVMTLCDRHRYLLLELPTEVVIDIEPLLIELCRAGVSVIISHPERHLIVSKRPQTVEKWLEHSVSLQITAGSLLGKFGPAAEEAAWFFLQQGWAQLVATDAHDAGKRYPCMTAAFERIATEKGPQIAREVCIENPMRILQDANLPNIYQKSTTGVSLWGPR
jgi:protein-tyrosine phosphatase